MRPYKLNKTKRERERVRAQASKERDLREANGFSRKLERDFGLLASFFAVEESKWLLVARLMAETS